MLRRAVLILITLCATLAPAAAQNYTRENLRIPFSAAGRARTGGAC